MLKNISDFGLFDNLLGMVTKNLREVSYQHMININNIRTEIFDAIEADMLIMAAPDTAIFQEHPEIGESIVEMLKNAKSSLKSLQKEAQSGISWGLREYTRED